MNTKYPDFTDDPTRSGIAFLRAVVARGRKDGLGQDALAAWLGLSPEYFAGLLSGEHPTNEISHADFRRISKALGVNVLQLMLLAEIVEPTDLIQDSGPALAVSLENIMECMRNDTYWSPMSPTADEFAGLRLETRLGIALLYEREKNRQLVSRAKLYGIKRFPPGMTTSAALKTKT